MSQKYFRWAAMISFIFFGFLVPPVLAKDLSWKTFDGGKIRVSFSSWNDKKNINPFVYGLVEIELEQGWKTYWKNPGNAGMSPEITLDSPGKAVFLFPVPQLIKNGPDWAFGYTGSVFLPFRIESQSFQKQRTISGNILIGFCHGICIPENILFQIQTVGRSDWLAAGKIKAILSDLPGEKRDNFQILELKPVYRNLHVLLRHPESEVTPELFMDSKNAQLGIAEVKYHKKTETFYIIPILSGEVGVGQQADYTAVLGDQAISSIAVIFSEDSK